MYGTMAGGGEIREVTPPKYQEFVDFPSMTLVSMNGLEFVVPDKCQTNAISQYDLNSDGVIDGADAYFAGVAPNERRDWIIERLRDNAYLCGEGTAYLDQMRDVVSISTKVQRAYDMVARLRRAQHEDDLWGNWQHTVYEYSPKTWRESVLPTIGTTENYESIVEGAANAFRRFASTYGISHTRSTGRVTSAGGVDEHPVDTVVYLTRLDPSVRGAAARVAGMMSAVTRFADSSWIECEGDACPQDNESDAIDTQLTSTLCYVMEENGDATCHDHTMNPYVSAVCWTPFLCRAHDDRSDETRYGATLSDMSLGLSKKLK